MAAPQAAPTTAPVITIYKNGDTYYHGKRLVLNRKVIRNFDAFLDRVTKDVSSKVAVRSIRTPSHGHRVADLDKLENGGVYVAVGPERFKKLEYKEVSNLPSHRPKPQEQIIRPVVHSRVIVSGRARKVAAAETSANKTIFVFRNGDDKHPSFKILLDKRVLNTNMNTILQFITEKVNLRTGAVKSLYTLDGMEILEPAQLKTTEKYVAVGFGKKFLKMAYNENSSSTTPRKSGPKVKSSEPPFRKRKQKLHVKAMSQGHVKSFPKSDDHFEDKRAREISSDENHTDLSSNSNNSDKDDSLLPGGIMQEILQPASRMSTDEGDGIIPTLVNEAKKTYEKERKTSKTVSDKKKSEAIAKRKQSKPKKSDAGLVKSKDKDVAKEVVDNERDDENIGSSNEKESTIFKATGEQAESANAVKDNKETSVEKPVDMLPAAEVEEELETGELEVEAHDHEKTRDSLGADESAKSPERPKSKERVAEPKTDND